MFYSLRAMNVSYLFNSQSKEMKSSIFASTLTALDLTSDFAAFLRKLFI